MLTRDKVYKFKATVSSRSAGDSKGLILESLEEIVNSSADLPPADKPSLPPAKLFINLKDTSDDKLLSSLKAVIDESSGDTKVILVLGDPKNHQAVRLPIGFDHLNAEAFGRLSELVGPENLVLS